eukprot:2384094-Ditylum_brightwellii.AAC.1
MSCFVYHTKSCSREMLTLGSCTWRRSSSSAIVWLAIVARITYIKNQGYILNLHIILGRPVTSVFLS